MCPTAGVAVQLLGITRTVAMGQRWAGRVGADGGQRRGYWLLSGRCIASFELLDQDAHHTTMRECNESN
jgi:hypothetical protein